MSATNIFPLNTLDDLLTIDWKTFEAFATETLRCYYKPYKLEVIPTAWQKDGARDAHASYLFGASAPQKGQRTLAAIFRLWVEVKQRSGPNIDLAVIGKNLVRAVNEDVSKLVVVTNRGFSSGLQREIENFAHRVRLDYCLLDGEKLLQVAHDVGTISSAPNLPRSETGARRTAAYRTPRKPRTRENSLNINLRCSFTADPSSDELLESRFYSEPGAPVFLMVDLTATHCSRPQTIKLKPLLAQPEFGELIVYRDAGGNAAGNNKSQEVPLTTGDCRRYIFVFFPRIHKDIPVSCFEFSVETNGASATIERAGMSTLTVRNRRMSDWIPPSREKVLEGLEREINDWLSSGGTSSRLLIANAGSGKSHAVSRLRRLWLTQGAIEVPLDGQSQGTDLAIMRRVFERAFPLEPKSFGDDQVEVITDWLEQAGMVHDRAAYVAAAICRGNDLSSVGAGLLAEIMVTLLRRLSVAAPLVVLFEDAHKSQPSALALLRDVQHRLKGEHIFIFMTSREEPLAPNEHDQAIWRQHLEVLLTVFRRAELPALTNPEAIELIRRSIPTLEPVHAHSIVEQVGSSPFGIREAISYLIDWGIARLDPVIQELVVMHPERLLESIQLEEFTEATRHRIQRLRGRAPDWLGTFLDAGALLGRFFPLETCLRVAGETDSLAVRDILGECERLEILKSSPFNIKEYGFDHDLVRSAILKDIPYARQQFIAEKLLEHVRLEADDSTIGILAYQSGHTEECVTYLSQAASAAAKRGRHIDAVKLLRIAIHALDPAGTSMVDAGIYFSNVDEALRRVKVPRISSMPRGTVYQELLTLIKRLIFSLTEISGGSGTEIGSAISEGMMLARRLSDYGAQAELEGYLGRHQFAEGNLVTSLKHHEKAETMYASLVDSPLIYSRIANLIRIAICFRQLGRRDESLTTLEKAESLRDPVDFSGRIKILSNTGGLFFYSDLTRVRKYWEEAMDTAYEGNIPERIVHCLVNLAQLDFIEDKFLNARHRLSIGMRIAEDLGLESSFVRILLYTAGIDMIDGDLDSARGYLLEAERIAAANLHDRPLWRIRANLATVEEMKGNMKKSYVRDCGVLERLETLLEPTKAAMSLGENIGREILPLVNIILRSNMSLLHATLAQKMQREIFSIAEPIAKKAESGDLREIPNLLGRHCKSVSGVFRFIVTE
jgi:tetratricopeptide (TPR) repeat protein